MNTRRPFPSSSSSTQKPISIYLWFRKFVSKHSKKSSWYKLDPAQLYSPESELTLVSETHLSKASSAVAWDSTIYVLAGSYEYYDESKQTREVYYLDTRRPDLGWKVGPALITPRNKVCAAVKGGKIFAFGGLESEFDLESRKRGGTDDVGKGISRRHPGEIWGEFLDPLLNTGRIIRGPSSKTHNTDGSRPDLEPDYKGVVADHERYDRSCLYELESDTWKRKVPWGSKSAFVGDIVYYYAYSSVCAFHLKRRIRLNTALGLSGCGVSPPSYKNNEHTAFLVHVGDGRLCLMWESERGLHCTKFRVTVHCDEDGEVAVLATVEAFRIFSKYEPRMHERLDTSYLKDCLAV